MTLVKPSPRRLPAFSLGLYIEDSKEDLFTDLEDEDKLEEMKLSRTTAECCIYIVHTGIGDIITCLRT